MQLQPYHESTTEEVCVCIIYKSQLLHTIDKYVYTAPKQVMDEKLQTLTTYIHETFYT